MANLKLGYIDATVHMLSVVDDKTMKLDEYEEAIWPKRLLSYCHPDKLCDWFKNSPVKYGIHSPITQFSEETLRVSIMAEEYYFVCGYLAWLDLERDLKIHSQLSRLSEDPMFVGVHYSLVYVEDSQNFSAREAGCKRERNGSWMLEGYESSNVMEALATIAYKKVTLDLVISLRHIRTITHLSYQQPTLIVVLTFSPCDLADLPATWKQDFLYMCQYPNIYCKVGAKTILSTTPETVDFSPEDDINVLQNFLHFCLESFGFNRCIFASGWPRAVGGCSALEECVQAIETIVSQIHYSNQHEHDTHLGQCKWKVLRENAQRIYKPCLRNY